MNISTWSLSHLPPTLDFTCGDVTDGVTGVFHVGQNVIHVETNYEWDCSLDMFFVWWTLFHSVHTFDIFTVVETGSCAFKQLFISISLSLIIYFFNVWVIQAWIFLLLCTLDSVLIFCAWSQFLSTSKKERERGEQTTVLAVSSCVLVIEFNSSFLSSCCFLHIRFCAWCDRCASTAAADGLTEKGGGSSAKGRPHRIGRWWRQSEDEPSYLHDRRRNIAPSHSSDQEETLHLKICSWT